MKIRLAAVLAVLMVCAGLTGCISSLTGAHYLQQEEYDKGIVSLKQQLAESPGDASANYYLGRMYMAKKEPKVALPYLERAAQLDPESAEYAFWVGVANWALLDFDAERQAYMRAIELDGRHISAHLYLGHNYLDRGEWEKALARYDRVLELDEYNPEALYNRGEALYALGRTDEAVKAWQEFLEAYPDGTLAFRAADWLNQFGDYTYRNFIIGQRKITLRVPQFEQGATTLSLTKESKPSLSVLGAMLDNNRKLEIHVVAFNASGAEEAKAMAQTTRDYIVSMWPEVAPSRLRLSWFGEGEKVQTVNGPKVIDKTVKFITVVENPVGG